MHVLLFQTLFENKQTYNEVKRSFVFHNTTLPVLCAETVVDSMNSEEIYFVKALIVREVIIKSNFRRSKVTFLRTIRRSKVVSSRQEIR
jgi:hypothetical protein